jgi:hypothetical protein
VPITITEARKLYDWVLIDDDEITHMTWKMTADEAKKSFIGFKTADEFDAKKLTIDPQSAIYVDSNLTNGIKGEDIAKQLHAQGFKNIFLATGYEAEHFAPMNYVRGIVGKQPPTA